MQRLLLQLLLLLMMMMWMMIVMRISVMPLLLPRPREAVAPTTVLVIFVDASATRSYQRRRRQRRRGGCVLQDVSDQERGTLVPVMKQLTRVQELLLLVMQGWKLTVKMERRRVMCEIHDNLITLFLSLY